MEDKEISIEKIQRQKIKCAQRIINCQNYIGTFHDNIIDIFELTKDLKLISKVSNSFENNITNIDFNSLYKDIILSIPGKII